MTFANQNQASTGQEVADLLYTLWRDNTNADGDSYIPPFAAALIQNIKGSFNLLRGTLQAVPGYDAANDLPRWGVSRSCDTGWLPIIDDAHSSTRNLVAGSAEFNAAIAAVVQRHDEQIAAIVTRKTTPSSQTAAASTATAAETETTPTTVRSSQTDRSIQRTRWNRDVATFTGEPIIEHDQALNRYISHNTQPETAEQTLQRVNGYFAFAAQIEAINNPADRAALVDQRRAARQNYQPPFWRAVRNSLTEKYPAQRTAIPTIIVSVNSRTQGLTWAVANDQPNRAEWQALMAGAREQAISVLPGETIAERINRWLSEDNNTELTDIDNILQAANTALAGQTGAQNTPVGNVTTTTPLQPVPNAEQDNQAANQARADFWNRSVRPFTGDASITVANGQLSIARKDGETEDAAAARLVGMLRLAGELQNLSATELLARIQAHNAESGRPRYQPRNWRIARQI
ncbi:MAG: hypothetical protein ACRC1U_10730, partial [Vibrionaceae bacterium]